MLSFSIDIPPILKKANLRSYYIAEYAKRKDIDLEIVATSVDNSDELRVYLETALDIVKNIMFTRSSETIVTLDVSSDSATYTISPYVPRNRALENTDSLKLAVSDYCISYILGRWLSLYNKDMVAPQEIETGNCLNRIINMVSLTCGSVRRTPTDLI